MTNNTKLRLEMFAGRALSTMQTVHNSYELAYKAIKDGIPGDFVECGVFCGTQVAAMAQACLDLDEPRIIHLFDSFEGIPMAGPNDDETITSCIGVGDGKGALITTGVSAASVETVQAIMAEYGIPSELLRYHKGWFQHTLPTDSDSIDKIAVLRLDGDLYDSTKVCFDYLGHKVQKGGWIILDDGNLTGALKAMWEWRTIHCPNAVHAQVPDSNPIYWQL